MKHIARSTLIIAFFFAIDKVFSLVRQLLIARQFALSYEIDVFHAANNIPDLLSALISGGALAVALIPVLTDYLKNRGSNAAWELFSHVINLAFIVTGILALLVYLLSPWLINTIIVPGFPVEQKELAIELMRLNLFALMIFSISGLVMAGLQANQHFLMPAIAPAAYDIGQIVGIAILAPSEGMTVGPITLPAFGLGIHGMVYGVIIGAAIHLLVQVPALFRYQFRWVPKLGLRTEGIQQVALLIAPRVVTMLFIQAFFIVRDALASGMGEGVVSALNYGWFIMQVPETLLGTAVAIALLPTLSANFSSKQTDEFSSKINIAVRVLLALTIPAAVYLSIGLYPLVEIAFGFDAQGTQMVVTAARVYLGGLVGHSLLEIAARAYYAKKNAITPLLAAAGNAIAYFVFAQVFSRALGFAGIALANTLVFTIQPIVMLWFLNRSHPGIFAVKTTLFRTLMITSVGAILLFAMMKLMPGLPPIISSLGGMAVCMAVTIFFLRKEIQPLMRMS